MSYFPVIIYIPEQKEVKLCNSPDDIPSFKVFKVIATNATEEQLTLCVRLTACIQHSHQGLEI